MEGVCRSPAFFACCIMSQWYVYAARAKKPRAKKSKDFQDIHVPGSTNNPDRRILQHRGIVAGGAKIFQKCKKIRFDFLVTAENFHKSTALRMEIILHGRPEKDKRDVIYDVISASEFDNLGAVYFYSDATTCDAFEEKARAEGAYDVWRHRLYAEFDNRTYDCVIIRRKQEAPPPPIFRTEVVRVIRKIRKVHPSLTLSQVKSFLTTVLAAPDLDAAV